MKIISTMYSGWTNQQSVYAVKTYDDFIEISKWMQLNGVDNKLLSSGFNGYIFEVRNNHEWFILKWL
jgi:hypothetical protein